MPELELRVLDEFDESDEESPRMRPVYDEALEQDAGDLLLNRLDVRLGEEIEQRAGEVVRVRVGITQLIRDRVEEQVSAFRVQIHGEVLENVHVRRVGDSRDGRSETSVVSDVLNRLSSHVQDFASGEGKGGKGV